MCLFVCFVLIVVSKSSTAALLSQRCGQCPSRPNHNCFGVGDANGVMVRAATNKIVGGWPAEAGGVPWQVELGVT